MRSLFFRLNSGQLFHFANLVAAKWTPPAPAGAINAPPGDRAAVAACLQLSFVGGHVESLSGEDAQAVWEYLAFMSSNQRANAAPAAERQQ